ncbi:uncharacterized protein LOC107035911 isoform X2 [Diachasma alloeum]|uniref:uncharacterized protein LOC107035911 isoform X2 n=1 Tax=Diachasma alloeum TaxID=454923 RepID=UPI000738138B|nr:uncharacterized protein LOC107035911 isoform X2 [Diachasma alloeum]
MASDHELTTSPFMVILEEELAETMSSDSDIFQKDQMNSLYKEGDELLIELVRSYRHLWDKKHPDKEPELVESSWMEIAESMLLSVSECKNRWIRLKQYYSKERHKRDEEAKSGRGRGSRKSWALFECMTFMDKHILKRRTYSGARRSQIEASFDSEENETVRQNKRPALVASSDDPLGESVVFPRKSQRLVAAENGEKEADEDSSELLHDLTTESLSPSRPSSAAQVEIRTETAETTCNAGKRPAPKVLAETSRSSPSASPTKPSRLQEMGPTNIADSLVESFRQATECISVVAHKLIQSDPSDQDQALVNMILALLKDSDGPRRVEFRRQLMSLTMEYMFPET